MTLNGHRPTELCCTSDASFGSFYEHLKKIRHILTAAEVTLRSCGIKYMRIFVGVPWRGSLTRLWSGQNQ